MAVPQPGMDALTPRSSRVVAARKLLRRRHRDGQGRFLVEGPQAVREALKYDGLVTELFATAAVSQRHGELIDAAESKGVKVKPVDDAAAAALSDTVAPQGIIAVCGYIDRTEVQAGRLVIVLDGISDPGNAGTIVRTADAAGADAVIFPDNTVDPYNGKCVRSAAGSLFHVPIVRGGSSIAHIAKLRAGGITVLAADAHAKYDLDAVIDDGLLKHPVAWLFGSEAHGLAPDVAREADMAVKVPIYGRAESLNLATAAAVCVYASARELRKGEPPT